MMTQADILEQLLTARRGTVTRCDARRFSIDAGVNPRLLSEWVEALGSKLERVQRGVYRSPDAPQGHAQHVA